jgi:hypothetical protein
MFCGLPDCDRSITAYVTVGFCLIVPSDCRHVEVYAASGEQPALDRRHDELSAEEKEVDLFFSAQQNVDRLIALLALEEKKGKDKFNGYRFLMFKVRVEKVLYVTFLYFDFYFRG